MDLVANPTHNGQPPAPSAGTSATRLLDLLPVGIVAVAADGSATAANQAWMELTGQTGGMWREDGWLRSLTSERGEAARLELHQAVTAGRSYEADWKVITTDGAVRVLQVHLAPDYHDGVHRGSVVTVVDVTTEREHAERLLVQATHDPLTGLVNRPQFLEFVAHSVDRRRREPRLLAAVLFIDVDNFKATNDTFGHDAGDELLRFLGDHIAAAVRPADVVARYGGDEFTVLCEDLHSSDEAEQIAGRIRTKLDFVAGRNVPCGLSVGFTLIDGSTTDPLTIVGEADRMMYLDKRARRW